MLLRLQVSGFKNLVDVDVRFGPFTCIAGGNGVGKSNLVDVVQLLSALADHPFMDALLGLRDEDRGPARASSFFFQAGEQPRATLTLVADLLIPREGRDAFGKSLTARATLLRYSLMLRRHGENKITIEHEELRSLTRAEGREALAPFGKLAAIAEEQPETSIAFLATSADGMLELRLEDTNEPRQLGPSTVLKSTLLTQAESLLFPTAYLAREELRSWRALHLEPRALRTPDRISEHETRLATDGAHMAALLNYLIENAASVDAQDDL